jgi:hypothetical protein
MDRGSNKHSPRLDDQMSDELRGTAPGVNGGRAEEWHMAEPSGEDQPDAEEILDESGVEQFSRFGRYIGLSALPGKRDKLRRSAESLEAPDDILAALDRLPADAEYLNVHEIWEAVGRRTG